MQKKEYGENYAQFIQMIALRNNIIRTPDLVSKK